MAHFTDSCRIEKIREQSPDNIKYYLTDLPGQLQYDPKYDGSFPIYDYDESICDGDDHKEDHSSGYVPSRKRKDGATCSPIRNGAGAYRKVSPERYCNLINLLKQFDKMNIKNILRLGNLIDPENSSNVRDKKVFLASRGAVDRAVVFPAVDKVKSRLKNLCDYVNSNPDNLDRIELASTFAYGFCMVHPFIDGNGRSSRLLANYFLGENEFFRQLSTDRLDYRKACFQINLTGDLDSMFKYFHKRLSEIKVSMN